MTSASFNPRAALLDLLARTSFRLGNFTLSSGAKSDYYIDCRTTTLHAEGGRLTGLAILDLLREHNLHPAAVGGLTMGADPVVSAVSIASAWHAQQEPGAPLIHGFLVRKAEKTHGTGRAPFFLSGKLAGRRLTDVGGLYIVRSVQREEGSTLAGGF